MNWIWTLAGEILAAAILGSLVFYVLGKSLDVAFAILTLGASVGKKAPLYKQIYDLVIIFFPSWQSLFWRTLQYGWPLTRSARW